MRCITRKKMLYKTKVDYQTGQDGWPVNDYAMNHVLGCMHGCKYPCYAMKASLRFKNVETEDDWREPRLVANTLELLERELVAKNDIRRVHLCFTTDPFPYLSWDDFVSRYRFPSGGYVVPPQWEIQDMTMAACDLINSHGIPVTILTKGVLPWFGFGADGPLCMPNREGGAKIWEDVNADNYYGISLVSVSEGFREVWEPYTAPFSERMSALRHLHDSGCKTWVSMEPFPALSSIGMAHLYGHVDDAHVADTRFGELYRCLESVSFVDRIVFGRWNYNPEMPSDVKHVDKWYANASQIVRDFCGGRGIECVIKGGTA